LGGRREPHVLGLPEHDRAAPVTEAGVDRLAVRPVDDRLDLEAERPLVELGAALHVRDPEDRRDPGLALRARALPRLPLGLAPLLAALRLRRLAAGLAARLVARLARFHGGPPELGFGLSPSSTIPV